MVKLPPIDLWFLFVRLKLDYAALLRISGMSGISIGTIENMLCGQAVYRDVATQFLSALSQETGYAWTLNNVKVALFD